MHIIMRIPTKIRIAPPMTAEMMIIVSDGPLPDIRRWKEWNEKRVWRSKSTSSTTTTTRGDNYFLVQNEQDDGESTAKLRLSVHLPIFLIR